MIKGIANSNPIDAGFSRQEDANAERTERDRTQYLLDCWYGREVYRPNRYFKQDLENPFVEAMTKYEEHRDKERKKKQNAYRLKKKLTKDGR